MSSVGWAVVVVGSIVVATAIAVFLLRWRKVRSDALRRTHREDPSLRSPPPSPYEVSRGVRLLEPGDEGRHRPEPTLPRLDPEVPYVFGDTTSLEFDPATLSRSRHDSRWALERSSHRSRLRPGSGKVLLVSSIFLVILYGLGAYLLHSTATSPTTSTTTTHPTTTTVPVQGTTTTTVHQI